MRKLINIIIFTLITFSFVGCFDNEARYGGLPYFVIEGVDSVQVVSNKSQTLIIPIGTNRGLDINLNYPINDGANWLYHWVNLTGDYQSEIKLDINENTQDFEREVTITISSKSGGESFKLKIIQESREYTQAEIFEGDAILSTRGEIDEFLKKGYKEIRGNLIIGTVSSSGKTRAQNSSNISVEIDGTTHHFTKNSEINYINSLNYLRKITGGLYVVGLNNIQDLHFIQNIVNLETLVAIHNPRLEKIIIPERIRTLKNLQLNNNNISDISFLSSHTGLKSLETLYLGNSIDETNTITDISALNSLTNLNELHLNFLPISLNQLNDLNSKLPNTNILAEGIPGANPEQIYHGDLFLRTQEDVNDFISTGYTEINGSVIIGNTSNTQSPTSLTNIWINSNTYYVDKSNSTIDLSSLKIYHVEEEVFLIGFPNITDLSSISSLSRATKLHIKYNDRLTDISILSNFTRLESLSLNYTQVSDISPLRNLTKLKKLQLNNNNISDIYPLSQLKNLESLYLGYTQDETNTIRQVYPLYYLTNLRELYLNYLQINLNEINQLKLSLPNINIRLEGVPGANPNLIYEGDLILSTQQDVDNFIATGRTEINGSLLIGNASTTSSAPYLTNIWLNNKNYYITSSNSALHLSSLRLTHVVGSVNLMGFENIPDLSIISSLTSIIRLELNISHNKNLTDISTLNSFSNLRSLDLSSNSKMSDISSLGNLTTLTDLSLRYNNFADLSSLSNLTGLTSLDISESINAITPVSNLRNLSSFSINGSTVSDISPLYNLTNLTTLSLEYNTSLTDFSQISNLTGLLSLSINNEQISDLSPIYPLKKITYLQLYSLPNITIAQINALKVELPNCDVNHWGIN